MDKKQYNKQYYQKNKEKLRAKTRTWRENNPEKVEAILDRIWQKRHPGEPRKKGQTKQEFVDKLNYAIELYKSGIPGYKAHKLAGISYNALYGNLKKLGLTRSNKELARKYTVNHNFFHIIDSEEKAYWLGFVYADGFILASRNQIGIALHIKDRNHLEKFKNTISATYPIKNYISKKSYGKTTKYSRIIVSSDNMKEDLQNKGVFIQKSLILKFPTENIVPDYLINHFIRGYFDGDGSFAKAGDSEYNVKICGTKEFLYKLAKMLGFEHLKMYKRYKDDKNNFYLSIGGRKQVKKIGEYMYQNATVYLERKYERFQEINY